MRAKSGVVLLFFLSGTSGLVFEVVWLRYLTLVIGHTTFAVSLVVSAFLGGLALGSLVVGRMAARWRSPLLAYAALETATGVLALGLSALLRRAASLGWLADSPIVVRAAVVFVLLLPPTIAMGGTLPVLTRFVARALPRIGKSFGLLYGVNTLGAATGCVVAGFWLIGAFGIWTTACIAASTNIVVAALAALLARVREPTTETAPVDSAPATPETKRHRLLIAAFVVTGWTSIAYEVLWFRVLGFYLPATSYAFTTLLATYLVGLVLGAALYATRFAGRVRDLSVFASAQLLLGWLGLLSMVLLGQVHGLRAALAGALSAGSAFGGTGHAAASPGQIVLFSLLPAAVIMLVPATVIGVVFPCVVQLTTRNLDTASRDVGLVYSANTLGGIVGSLVVGFVLIPNLGTQATFLLTCALNGLVAVLVLRLDDVATRRERWRVWLGVAFLFPAMRIVPFDHLLRSFSETLAGRTLQLTEGRDGLVSVIEYSDKCRDVAFQHRQIRFGSVSYASTLMSGRRYMATLAHLPMLTHDAPRDALVVCFGTGTTAGTFARYPDLGSLTVVDTNPDVLAAAPLFEESNYGVAKDPRTSLVVDDGRHYLLEHPRSFDVISFEPPPPTSAGVVNLYTRELYELIAHRLGERGILTQWIPLDHQSDAQDRMLVRSVLDAFPYVALFVPSRHEGIVVASRSPIVIDVDRWRSRWNAEPLGEALRGVGYSSPESLIATFVAGRAELDPWARGYAAVTDDLPAVEYFLQRNDGPFRIDALLEPPSNLTPLLSPHTSADQRAAIEVQRRATALMLSAHQASRTGDYDLALRRVAEAAQAGGANAFTEYSERIDYRCLR